MERNVERLRVVKTLSPSQSGAIELARKHGDALLERTPIQSRSDRLVGVRIGPGEKQLQAAARASVAKWDSSEKLWRMPRRTATRVHTPGSLLPDAASKLVLYITVGAASHAAVRRPPRRNRPSAVGDRSNASFALPRGL